MLRRTYELDMVPGGIPLSIHLSQYDSEVQLTFQLYASQGTLAIPETGVTAQIRGTKLDGNGIFLCLGSGLGILLCTGRSIFSPLGELGHLLLGLLGNLECFNDAVRICEDFLNLLDL